MTKLARHASAVANPAIGLSQAGRRRQLDLLRLSLSRHSQLRLAREIGLEPIILAFNVPADVTSTDLFAALSRAVVVRRRYGAIRPVNVVQRCVTVRCF
jgi:hypothetical protein